MKPHVNHTVHDQNGTTGQATSLHPWSGRSRIGVESIATTGTRGEEWQCWGAPAQRYWLRHQETATQRLQMGGSFLVWVFGALTLSQNHVEILGTGTTYRCTLGAVWHASPITADIFEQFDAFPPRFPSDPTNPSFLTNPTCRAFQAVGTSPMVTQNSCFLRKKPALDAAWPDSSLAQLPAKPWPWCPNGPSV